VQVLIGQSMIMLGLLFTIFGVYTVLRLQGLYARLVVTSKVETMGFVTIMFGVMILTGVSFVTVKLAIIVLFELLTVPVSAHAVGRSAYVSGYRIRNITHRGENAATGDADSEESIDA